VCWRVCCTYPSSWKSWFTLIPGSFDGLEDLQYVWSGEFWVTCLLYSVESDGEKQPITQSIISPRIEGAIIAAKGAANVDVKTKIVQAVEAVTGLATHKIQVFEMQS